MRMVVDLPAPFGPRNPKISPLRDLETDVIDCHKVAEALHQISNHDRIVGVSS